MRVLVIDDSAPFRTQIRKVLESIMGVEVVGTASNGKIGISMLKQKAVDLVTLDLNMPVMDGLDTLKQIKADASLGDVKVIVFAAKSARSAKDTLEALSLGAIDFIVKPDGATFSLSDAAEQVSAQLAPRVKLFLKAQQSVVPVARAAGTTVTVPQSNISSTSGSIAGSRNQRLQSVSSNIENAAFDMFRPKAVVIASSTGGPGALEAMFKHLRGPTLAPILIAQHMPETFTKYLAKRIEDITGIEAREGENGEKIKPNRIYVAPGDYHMSIIDGNGEACLKIDQGPRMHNVRPAADILFNSAADFFGKGLMSFVLTGMGEDGGAGAEYVKSLGGKCMIQDKESSVVWGMPMAVYERNAYDRMSNINECGRILRQMVTKN